jgi:hypothetical protein
MSRASKGRPGQPRLRPLSTPVQLDGPHSFKTRSGAVYLDLPQIRASPSRRIAGTPRPASRAAFAVSVGPPQQHRPSPPAKRWPIPAVVRPCTHFHYSPFCFPNVGDFPLSQFCTMALRIAARRRQIAVMGNTSNTRPRGPWPQAAPSRMIPGPESRCSLCFVCPGGLEPFS